MVKLKVNADEIFILMGGLYMMYHGLQHILSSELVVKIAMAFALATAM
jgi:hypothetical protein